jgi:hypothetical protein
MMKSLNLFYQNRNVNFSISLNAEIVEVANVNTEMYDDTFNDPNLVSNAYQLMSIIDANKEIIYRAHPDGYYVKCDLSMVLISSKLI